MLAGRNVDDRKNKDKSLDFTVKETSADKVPVGQKNKENAFPLKTKKASKTAC